MNSLNVLNATDEHPILLARETGSNKVVDNIEYGHNFVINTLDNKREKSPDGALLVIGNAKRLKTLNSVGIIKNHSSNTQKINVVFTMPKFDGVLMGINTYIQKEPQFNKEITSAGSNLKVYYSGQAGVYVPKSEFLNKYTWDELLGVQISGDMIGNENIEITFNYLYEELTNEILYDPTRSITIRSYGYMPSKYDSSYTMLRFANPEKLPTKRPYAVIRNDDGTYTTYDDKVQSLLTNLNDNDFQVYNFYDLTTIEQYNKLFTGGMFALNLNSINETLIKDGYSVGATDDKTFRKQYYYSVILDNPPIIKDDQGQTVIIPNESLYIEVHKVIDAKDLELKVGDSWSNKDNLISVTSPFDGSDLKDNVIIEANVDTSKKGVYPVKYKVNFEDKEITKTVNVTVRDNDVLESTVTTHFKTKDGLSLKPPVVQTLTFGSKYTTDADKVLTYNNKEYELIETPKNSEGVVTEVNQDVVYIYQALKDKVSAPITKPDSSNKLPKTGLPAYDLLYVLIGVSALSLILHMKKSKDKPLN